MAEAATAAPVPVVAAGRGRGKGKAKGKKGKKGKFAMKVAKPVEGEEGYVPKPKKEPKVNLRAEVEASVGDRNIQDVIAEARAKVEEMQAAVSKAQEAEMGYETNILNGKLAMETASAQVDSCVHKETIALEKFKAAKQALIEAQKKVAEKKLAVGEEDKALSVLSSEGEKNKLEADLIKAKEDAHKAREEAKRALEEAKAREKAVQEEIKAKRSALALTDDPDAAAKAQASAEKEAEEAKERKEAKALGATAAKDLKQEVKDLEKARADRDKERAKLFKEAAGLGKVSKRKALGDGASPAKVGKAGEKIQDVD